MRVRAHHRRIAVVEARRMFWSSRSVGDLKHGHKDDHPSHEAQDKQSVEELPGGARPGDAAGVRRRANWEDMDAATRRLWAQLGWTAGNWYAANVLRV